MGRQYRDSKGIDGEAGDREGEEREKLVPTLGYVPEYG